MSTERHPDKEKALSAALAHIQKAFGKEAIMRYGQRGDQPVVESVSTGSLGLDIGLGIGGLPLGRIFSAEFYVSFAQALSETTPSPAWGPLLV